MSVNLPGPYEIEFSLVGWTAPTREHKIRNSVVAVGTPAIGAAPTAINIQTAGGGSKTLQAVADQAWSFLRSFYNTSISCSGFTFWKYVAGTFAKDFVSAGVPANPAGTGGGVTIAHQTVMTFRSANGGIQKWSLLENSQTGSTQIALVPNAAGTIAQKWAAYILSTDGAFIARDNAYPIAALRVSEGENERVWRKVFRGK